MYGADMFNDAIGDISEEDLLFMELLNKPKAKSTVIKKIKDALFSADPLNLQSIKMPWLEAFIMN